MKTAILLGKENIRVENVTPPPLKPGEARVRIEAALTCGTDLKVFKRGYHAKMIAPPAVFGHEFSGTICEISSSGRESAHPENLKTNQRRLTPAATNFTDWKIGDRVVAANSAPCSDCFFCKNSQENLCDDLLFLNGAYAETIVVPARIVEKNLLRLKSETNFRDAALTEPLACVVQGVEDLKLRAGQNVLVLGAGPIGLMFVALAKNLGCNVFVAGRGEKRLAMAKNLGAETIFEVGKDGDVVAAVKKLETGKAFGVRGHVRALKSGDMSPQSKFDAVIEAIGKPEIWEAAVHLVRKGGAVNFFGGCPGGTTVSFDTQLIHYSNLTLLASFHHTPRAIRRALELIEAGVIRAADFVDGECPLTQLPELFKSMAAGNRAVKTLIKVRES